MFYDPIIASHDGYEEDLSFFTPDIGEEHSLGVRVDKNGYMESFVNGESEGRLLDPLPQPQHLWGVVILFPSAKIQSEFHLGG